MSHAPKIEHVRDATLVKRKAKAKLKLSDWPTRGDKLFEDKKVAKSSLDEDAAAIDKLQDALFAEQKHSLLVVLQGIDTSGKDGTVKSVFKYTSPLGVRVYPFGAPTGVELAHDYLWRVHPLAPRKGHIAVFNRSHYEDVLIAKVRKLAPPDRIEQRYDQINDFERLLTENGTQILKLMLHVSRDEQGERLKERLAVPAKRWKFNPSDLEDRKLWDEFGDAYTTMLERCSSEHAPWHVVPSDSRTRRDAIAARLVRGMLEDMNPQYPDPGYRPEQYEID